MEIFNTTDLLDFTLDDDAEEDEAPKKCLKKGSATAATLSPEFEEELEWISNKDAFPSVDTCYDILSENLELIQNRHSPVSVLDDSTTSNRGSTATTVAGFLKVLGSFPVRPRSKNLRRKRKTGFGQLSSQRAWLPASTRSTSNRVSMGRRCLHCQADETPQWRAWPMGPKTLCNACGVRYKSGRLVPEYRLVNSPTFSSVLHSNSHRKVVEMGRKKYLAKVEENGANAFLSSLSNHCLHFVRIISLG